MKIDTLKIVLIRIKRNTYCAELTIRISQNSVFGEFFSVFIILLYLLDSAHAHIHTYIQTDTNTNTHTHFTRRQFFFQFLVLCPAIIGIFLLTGVLLVATFSTTRLGHP